MADAKWPNDRKKDEIGEIRLVRIYQVAYNDFDMKILKFQIADQKWQGGLFYKSFSI